MASNANLWVLDFLLEADGLDDTLIKHFHDVNASQFEELPSNTQARLMLRVLRDAPAQPTGIAEAALGALNMLKNLADHLPGADLDALKPTSELFTEVKTELVLKSLREGNQGEHPRVILDTFFVPPESGGQLDPLELERRLEIEEGLKGAGEAQLLLQKYPVENLNLNLLSFVAAARTALGPNMLKVVEKDIAEGRYTPQGLTQAAVLQQATEQQEPSATAPAQNGKGKGSRGGQKRRRTKGTTTTEEDAAGMLANMSQSNALQAAGQLVPDAGQQAQPTGTPAAGQTVAPDGAEGGTLALAPPVQEGSAPASATPPMALPADGQAARPGQPPRRRNGRWNETETNFLIRMVREKGKGKWKRILEEGGNIFQNRSQVDLKDKWRNLERQGVVGPQDLPPQQMNQLGGHQIQVGMPPHVTQAQLGPDGQIHAFLGPDGSPIPLTADQAHQYAQALTAHYAQIAASQQQQQLAQNQEAAQMHQMAHVVPQHLQTAAPLQQMMQQPDGSEPQAQEGAIVEAHIEEPQAEHVPSNAEGQQQHDFQEQQQQQQ